MQGLPKLIQVCRACSISSAVIREGTVSATMNPISVSVLSCIPGIP
jgi:hypothetical protein